MTTNGTRKDEGSPWRPDPGCDSHCAEFPGLRESRRNPDRVDAGFIASTDVFADGHSVQYRPKSRDHREGAPTLVDKLKRFAIPEQLGVQHLIERVVMGRTEYVREDLIPRAAMIDGGTLRVRGAPASLTRVIVGEAMDERLFLPAIPGGEAVVAVPEADLRRLVIAAREVAFAHGQASDRGFDEAVDELDAASEVMRDRFDWGERCFTCRTKCGHEPDCPENEAEPSDPAVDGVAEMIARDHHGQASTPEETRDLAERIVTGLRVAIMEEAIEARLAVPSTSTAAAS